jgi:hypothetical protein
MRAFICAAAGAAVAACGSGERRTAADGEVRLVALGAAELLVHPGERRTLQVAAVRGASEPLPGERVSFRIEGGRASGSALSAASATADAAGVATVELSCGAAPASLEVVAAPASSAPAEAVFSVRIEPIRRVLQVVSSPGATSASDGQSAWVAAPRSAAVALRVREIDADTGERIEGDAIEFALPPASYASGFPGTSAHARTGAGGVAQAVLRTGAEIEHFEVSAVSLSGGDPVFFDVAVGGETGPPEQGCGPDVPCPFGYECASGACAPPEPRACAPDDPRSCPGGYECACDDPAGCACEPICGACPAGQTCDPGVRACVAAPAIPDATGTWYVRHSFRLGPLPFALEAAFDSLRGLDQLLAGALGLPWWAERIVRSVMHRYVPASFRTLVRIGDDLGTVLSTVRGEATMRLRPGIDAAHLRGSEEWTALAFYWLPLCGDSVDGDFDVPPGCARIDVLSGDTGAPERAGSCPFPEVSVEAAPFDATVERDGAGWRLAVPSRRIRIRMDQAALAAVDAILGAATPWRCVEEATDCSDGKECVVDCPGLASWTSALTSGVVPASAIEAGCASVVGAAGRTAGKLLGEVAFASDTLDFGGSATVSRIGDDDSCESAANCAGQLGNEAFDRDLRLDPQARDGAWEGAFFDPVARDLPGAWEARRSPW